MMIKFRKIPEISPKNPEIFLKNLKNLPAREWGVGPMGGPRLRREGVSKILDDRGIFGPLHTSAHTSISSRIQILPLKKVEFSDVC